jgi:hypothetical protein
MGKQDSSILQTTDEEWVVFPGGELEGRRPRGLCPDCRKRLTRDAGARAPGRTSASPRRPLCFRCYRAELDRARALKAAGEIETASEARFQSALPFEPVNETRLAFLKVERMAARTATRAGAGRFADRRGLAQIAARRALQAAVVALESQPISASARAHEVAAAIHAAELQLPESWLPFVVSR